jgi:hypothetical protein
MTAMNRKSDEVDQASHGGGKRNAAKQPSKANRLDRNDRGGRASDDPQEMSGTDEERRERAAERDPAEGKR